MQENNFFGVKNLDGILRCSRYAFGPNRLHYCGPNASGQVFGYIKHDFVDTGLKELLMAFQTMYPYLRHIAAANGIRDPFHARVVEAYWMGNNLLDIVRKKTYYDYVRDDLNMKYRMSSQKFREVEEKIRSGGVPHHSFHVFNLWKMSGSDIAEGLEQLDECRVSWGKVVQVEGPWITVRTRPVVLDAQGRYVFGSPVKKRVVRSLGADVDIDMIAVGDSITLHWSVPCEVISLQQAKYLDYYTQLSLDLANRRKKFEKEK
jgi:hypothetical protein